MLNFDFEIFTDDCTRIGAAALLGGMLGLERELNGHFAGLRTHMMVAIGCAVLLGPIGQSVLTMFTSVLPGF